MDVKPLRFISEPIQVDFEEAPTLEKRQGCPIRFTWDDITYEIVEQLSEWHDYPTRGSPQVSATPNLASARRGSWGVGRDFYRVLTQTGQLFELYYDRAPSRSGGRKGGWFLYREVALAESD